MSGCLLLLSLAAFMPTPPAERQATEELHPSESLTLMASDVTAAKGEEACVEIRASGFSDILTMQYSMNWDPKVLKFKGVRNHNLPGLTKNNFGEHLTPQGALTHSWYDPNLRGLSKPEGHKLYEVCFEVIGENGSACKFDFSGKPTMIEITNATGALLDLKTAGGTIAVK